MKGEFSVSATTKVHFSKGNLQYVGTWQFAEHQWDYFGNNQSDNHFDLFGWGTGDAPNKVTLDNTDYPTFTDWGTNAITNGGNQPNMWRTLTNDEWGYLFYTRDKAADLFGLGIVCGVRGVILLPDNWKLPKGATFTISTTQGLIVQDGYYTNSNDNNYSHNTYTAEQWSVMESAGAVFLPAAGYRYGTVGYCIGLDGEYWSTTPYYEYNAYTLDFRSDRLNPQSGSERCLGRAVRLVR